MAEDTDIDELLKAARLKAQQIALDALSHILAAHGCKSWPELELKMAEQVLAERLANGNNS